MNSTSTKYRSKRRDQVRVVRAGAGVGRKRTAPPETDTGTLSYRIGGPDFTAIFESALLRNGNEIERRLSQQIGRLTTTFDLQYDLASQYLWLIDCPIAAEISPVNDVLMPCFHKSLISLVTAFHLTKHGLWGPARPLIRHAFESLVIAKYCSVNHQSDVFDKWVDGVGLYFTNGVLKKIEKPDTAEFVSFWNLMCNYTHSSVYASQPDFNLKDYLGEVELNLVFIEGMMECKYHLLISHIITENMRYYQNRYKDGDYAKELRRQLRSNYSEAKKSMGAGAKALVCHFRSTWIVKA